MLSSTEFEKKFKYNSSYMDMVLVKKKHRMKRDFIILHEAKKLAPAMECYFCLRILGKKLKMAKRTVCDGKCYYNNNMIIIIIIIVSYTLH